MRELHAESNEIEQCIEQLDRFIAETRTGDHVPTSRQTEDLELRAMYLLSDLHIAYIRWSRTQRGMTCLISDATNSGSYEALSSLMNERQEIERAVWRSVPAIRDRLDKWALDVANKPGWVGSFWRMP